MNNVLCHIVGMNDQLKDYFLNILNKRKKYIIVCDIDEITKKIINDNIMNTLYNKYEYYLNKSKELNNGLGSKNFIQKYKNTEKTMNKFWKSKCGGIKYKLLI